MGEVEAALAAGGTVAEGLVAYERVMRPVVEDVQDCRRGAPGWPTRAPGVAVAAARTALRVAGSRPARRLAGLLPVATTVPPGGADYPASPALPVARRPDRPRHGRGGGQPGPRDGGAERLGAGRIHPTGCSDSATAAAA